MAGSHQCAGQFAYALLGLMFHLSSRTHPTHPLPVTSAFILPYFSVFYTDLFGEVLDRIVVVL